MLIVLTRGGVQNYGKHADIILECSLMCYVLCSVLYDMYRVLSVTSNSCVVLNVMFMY